MSVITLHTDDTPTPAGLVWENPPTRPRRAMSTTTSTRTEAQWLSEAYAVLADKGPAEASVVLYVAARDLAGQARWRDGAHR